VIVPASRVTTVVSSVEYYAMSLKLLDSRRILVKAPEGLVDKGFLTS
jgi:hypothetical protein